MSPRIILKTGLAVFKNHQILMVETESAGDAYYFLGGKIEAGESDLDSLIREVKEEANTEINLDSIQYIGEFTTEAHGRENTLVTMRLYSGELLGEPQPSAEVTGIVYCDTTMDAKHFTPLSRQVFPFLQSQKLIK
jgi:8-oxo-dGTP diphosphatase